MTLDASGNLLVGTTSNAGKLTVVGGTTSLSLSAAGTQTVLKLNNDDTTVGTNAVKLGFTSSNVVKSSINVAVYNNDYMTFNVGSDTERMRIDASGNVGIGTSSPNIDGGTARALTLNSASSGARLELASGGTRYGQFFAGSSGAFITAFTAIPLVFEVNGSERARIDSDGNFLFGMTVASGNGFIVYPDGSSTDVPLIDCRGDSASNSLKSYRVFSTSLGQEQFYVSYAGTVFARSTSISALSDQREKQNIRTLETGLTEVLALQPRRFDWKNGQGENVAGFIAQEVQAVLPDLIDEYSLSDTEKRMALKMGDMIPTLVKAIQEQQAIIESLKARLDAANL
jgi:dipeptidyl aminopeptidase/acylaminoacyl peptidase